MNVISRVDDGQEVAARSQGRCLGFLLAADVILLAFAISLILRQHLEIVALKSAPPPLPLAVRKIDGATSTISAAAIDKSLKNPTHQKIINITRLRESVRTARAIEAIKQAYGPLTQNLKLDPEKTAQFVRLIHEEELVAKDALQAAKANRLQSQQDYVVAVKEAVGRVDLQMQELLSPGDYREFINYRSSLPEQETLAHLSKSVAATATPLTEGQQGQLAVILKQLLPQEFKQNEDYFGIIGLSEVPLNSTMVNAASAVLTNPQLRVFDGMVSSQQAREAMIEALLKK